MKQQRKRIRKCIAILTTLAMVLSLGAGITLPRKAQAAGYGLSNPVTDSNGVTTWDCVYFGNYPTEYKLMPTPKPVPPSATPKLVTPTPKPVIPLVTPTPKPMTPSVTPKYAGSSTSKKNKSNIIQWKDVQQTARPKVTPTLEVEQTVKPAVTPTIAPTKSPQPSKPSEQAMEKQPIKWRVLSVDGDDAFLLADQNLDAKPYNTSDTSVTWETCTMRSWLNGYGASDNVEGTDYSSDNFLDTAFTAEERAAICQTTVVNEDNPYFDIEGGNDTTDRVYLLSIAEASNASYGFNSEFLTYSKTREAKNTAYAKSQGAWTSTSTEYEGNGYWWLRSPGYLSGNASAVYYYGYGNYGDYDVSSESLAVRPALHLNLSSSPLWSYAGTVSSEGGSSATAAPDSGEDSGRKLQCDAVCNVDVGQTESLCAHAYEDSLEALKEVTGNVTWTSSDTKVAQVSGYGFILPTTATTYATQNGSKEVWSATGLFSVKGIAPGTATITCEAADGSKTTCEVTVSEADTGTGTGSEGNGGAFTLGEDKDFTGKEGTSDFFPNSWSFKMSDYPIEISKTVDAENGSYTIKGSVGIGRSDIFDNTTEWNKFKKNVDTAQKAMGRMEWLSEFQKAWNVQTITMVTTDKCEKLPKLSIMGYFENTYDKNGNLISDQGGFAADASWKGSINWQSFTPIGPLYMTLTGSGKLSGNIYGQYEHAKKKLNIVKGSLKVTPSLSIEGGYGIDKVATVGAQGTLSVPITLIPASKGEFSAKASLHVKLIFVIDYIHDLAEYKTTIWDTSGNKKSVAGNVISLSEGSLSEMDTSFAKAEGDWNSGHLKKGKKKALLKGIGDAFAENLTVLQTGILPSSLPRQIQIGSKRVMIFQAYDKERDTLNSSVLKYSVYENGIWSEPKNVSEEATADLYADMQVVDGQLVLVWQKEKCEITGDVDSDSTEVLASMAQNSEIYFSAFDEENDTLTQPVLVTDNADYDCMPRICADSDDIIVSWIRNDSASLMQEEGTNRIYTAEWNGTSFEEEQELGEAPGTIDDYVVYQKDGSVSAVYTGQANELRAVFDTEGQVIPALTDVMTAAADGTISGLQYADGVVRLTANGSLYQYDVSEDSAQSFMAGQSAFGAEAKYCTNGTKSGYIWSTYDEETDTGRLVVSMETEEGYSEPVTLWEQEGVIWRYYSPLLDDDGNWQVAANVQNTETDINTLVYAEKKQETKLELAGASIDEDNTKDGLTAVDYFVKNTQDTVLDQIEISIKLADGSTITKHVPTSVQPGESLAGTAYVDLSGVDTAQDVTISVYGDGQKDTSECEVSDRVGLADLAVEASHEKTEDEIQITATVNNTGAAAADTTLYLYKDAEKFEVLQKKEGLSFAAEDSQKVSFTVKKTDLSYNENDAAYLTVYAQAADGDYNEDNNMAYVVLYREDLEPSPSVISTAKPTKTPVVTPTAKPTKKPVNTPSAKPTKKPSAAPSAGTRMTAAPGAKVSPSAVPAKAQTPRKGQVFKDVKTKAYYKILSVTAKGGKVAYLRPASQKAGKVTIKALVTWRGRKFQVTQIGNKAFEDCKKLQKVTIGRNVSVIGKKTFAGCKSLKLVILTDPKQELPQNAFAGCPRKPKVRKDF